MADSQPPTLRSRATRSWQDICAELEAEICSVFDDANTLPHARLIKLLAELKLLRERSEK